MEDKYFFEVDNTCAYCTEETNETNRESTHFICRACGTGMCDKCFNCMIDHDSHCFDYSESVEDDELCAHIEKCTGAPSGYMCYTCIEQLSDNLKALKEAK